MARRKAKRKSDDAPAVQGVLTLGTRSHVGMKRSANQDAFCALVGPNAPAGSDALLAVADGMGGHKAGEVASEMAIRGLVGRLSRNGGGDATVPGSGGLVLVLQRAVGELNAEIHTAAARPETRGMGTTLTAAVLVGDALTIGHVGDSRAYLLRGGKMQQLTQDHSWVAEQVTRGVLTAEEAEEHPRKNILTRAIGVEPRVQVDGMAIEVEEGDVLLICSDGLHSLVRDPEIARILAGGNPQSASEQLVDLANANGGNDNVTVVVARVDSVSPHSGSSQKVHDKTTVSVGGAPPSKSRRAPTGATRVLLSPLGVPVWLLSRLARSLFRRNG
jgi:protein phosphatase